MMDRGNILYALFAGILAIVPLFFNIYWVDVLSLVGLYTILGLSLESYCRRCRAFQSWACGVLCYWGLYGGYF